MPVLTPIATQDNLLLSGGIFAGGSEFSPGVAAGAAGGFIATWREFLPPSTDLDGQTTVVFRRFDADGTALGDPVPVTANLAGGSSGSGIVALSNGNVAIAWDMSVADPDGAGPASAATRVGVVLVDPATGGSVGSEIALASGGGLGDGTGVALHQVVALSEGRAGVLYFDTTGTDRLLLRVVEADGTAGAGPVTLLTAGSGFPIGIGQVDKATALGGPNADVLALVVSLPAPSFATQVRFIGTDGSEILNKRIDLGSLNSVPTVAAMPDGGVAVAWQDASTGSGHTHRVQRYDGNLDPVGGPVDVEFPYINFDSAPELIALPDGGLVVAVSGVLFSNFNDANIFAQRIAPDGTLDGGIVQLNLDPLNRYQTRPQLAVTGDGDLVAVWEDGSDFQIRAARFDLGLATPGENQAGDWRDDTLLGGAGPDTLIGRGGDDLLQGGGGNDRLLGRADDDRLLGEGGDDQLLGEDGDDTLDGGEGRDALLGGAGADSLDGGAGDDAARGGLGADTLAGGEGNDLLRGEADADLLQGGAGADRLFGDAGADTLEGGAGADTLVGGADADVFRYSAFADSATDAPDLLRAFARGVDRIDLSALDADAATPGDDAFAFIGFAAFAGGEGVAQVRLVRDLVERQILVLVDSGDADAEADMAIAVAGTGRLTAADFLL